MSSVGTRDVESFRQLLERIAAGQHVDQAALMPFLVAETVAERQMVNLCLARAFAAQGSPSSLERARDCVEKAWLLAEYGSPEVLRVLLDVQRARDDTEAIKEAYKRIGLQCLRQQRFGAALEYFDRWHAVYAQQRGEDRYVHDADILAAIDNALERWRFTVAPVDVRGRKIRLGYLVKGVRDPGSVMVKILALLVDHRDRERFDVTLYFPEAPSMCRSDTARRNLAQLEGKGVLLVFADEEADTLQRLLSVAARIHQAGTDVLVFSAALALFEHYALAALRPAPLAVCLNQGPVAQFAWHRFDYAISWFRTNVTDCPTDTTCVPLELDLQYVEQHRAQTRAALSLPEDAVIAFSGGRSAKFQDPRFFRMMAALLRRHPQLHYLVVGFGWDQATVAHPLLSTRDRERTSFVSWNDHYLDYLCAADLVIDSWPTGGGVVMLDAMALAKPVLSFHHDFLRVNDGSFGSAADDVLAIDELVVERGNFEQLERRASALIESAPERQRLGEQARATIAAERGNPQRMTRRCEAVVGELCHGRQTQAAARDLCAYDVAALAVENYHAWQKAYAAGYRSCMGDHRRYFYNVQLKEIGLYDAMVRSRRTVEYGAFDGTFMGQFVEQLAKTEFILAEYAPDRVAQLERTFCRYPNVKVMLNYPEISTLTQVGLCFSFLLAQSMPKTLWMRHLACVRSMLHPRGVYIFQFAHNPPGPADDLVENGVNGSNQYSAESMAELVREAGYRRWQMTEPITLEQLDSDVVWYFCRAHR